MPRHVRTLRGTSVVWRADNCHCQAAEFMLSQRAKLWCTLQLRGQRHSRCLASPLPSSVAGTSAIPYEENTAKA